MQMQKSPLAQMAHLTVVGPLHEGLVPVVGTVGDQRVHGRISLSKIQNPSPIPAAAQTLSTNYDAPIHLHVIIHPNGQIDGMPVALKDAASTKILRTIVNKFGGSSHSVVLDGDLRRYPQVMYICIFVARVRMCSRTSMPFEVTSTHTRLQLLDA
jgi:hypothetical protein